MSSSTEDGGSEPELITKIWQKREDFRSKRAALNEVEGELLQLLTKLEAQGYSIVELIKICNEPLLLSHVLKQGRYSGIEGEARSLTEIYTRVARIAQDVNNERE